MKRIETHICRTLVVPMIVALATCPANAQDAAEIKQWQVYEVVMSATRNETNPYVAYLQEASPARVTVCFTGTTGDAAGQEITVAGFWDGDTTWKARFAPPAPGEWVFQSRSEDSGLNGVAGKLTCTKWTEEEKQANPTRRGFIRVHSDGDRAGRYFEYTDGTPFLWIGDTWWNWTQRGIRFETFKNLVDDRVKKGFTVGQLFFPANGWSRRSSLLDEDYSQPDIEHIRFVERCIAYANERGMTVWIHPWWSRARLNEAAGPEKIRRWWRYVIHRLSAYNVIWTLAGEYNMYNYGGLGLDFWKGLGAMVAREDPFGHVIGVHPTPPAWDGGAEAPQWSTAEVLHNEPWLDYNQSQTAHARWRNEYAPIVVSQAYAMSPPKPIVITEPWYEFALDCPAAREIRFCAWAAVMSGAAGHTYGGGHIWVGYLPEVSRPRRGSGGSWPIDPDLGANTLDYPGARGMAYMAGILRSVDWWRLEPHPEFVVENPSRYCLAVPGQVYLMFLRWGGAVKLDLTEYESTNYTCQWIDLVTEKAHNPRQIKGGDIQVIKAPEDFPGVRQEKDWILLIKAIKQPPGPKPTTDRRGQRSARKINWVNPKIAQMPGLSHHILASKTMGHDVGYVVWTPPDYSVQSTKRYPVIYFLHGAGGSEAADAGGFSGWAAKAIADGSLPPALCVFPNGGMSGYRGNVEKMIVEELITTIDRDYRTIARAGSRAVAGFSMGGSGSVYLSIMHPGLFCAAGSMGGGIRGGSEQTDEAIEKAIPVWKKNDFGFFLVNGDNDRPDAFKKFSTTLEKNGIEHEVLILPDTKHNLGLYYERSVSKLLAFLGKHLRQQEKAIHGSQGDRPGSNI
jgi:enterochelin esterase-like enzyme